jgi:hypothetical protein
MGVVRFFAAESAEELAAEMINIIAIPPTMPSKEETAMQLTMRQRELGKLLLKISKMVANPIDSGTAGEFAERNPTNSR